ncbi:hypothetical protein LguiB_024857 [Lonicera macranthoides]
MDPQATMMNDGSFQSATATSFNLAEIWPFPINAACASGGQSGGKLDLRRVQFGHSLGQFADNANPNRDVSIDDPMILDQRGTNNGGGTRKRGEEDRSAAKGVSTSSAGNAMNYVDTKRLKTSGYRDENDEPNEDMETNSGKLVEQNTKLPTEQPKQDYIHVRARRGQATDSHSLAERVIYSNPLFLDYEDHNLAHGSGFWARREKISERMRILQDLVPGCNKVIGKALVLDEIINYIQSLQRQVEFLSMKLEAVNSRPNPSIEGFSSTDYAQQTIDMAGVAFGSQAPKEYSRGSSPDWLHMQIGGGFERTT